tara:strand:+ start:29 stop:1921 length:1893 start_codon:yes stop_codon:yes gene_type:complete
MLKINKNISLITYVLLVLCIFNLSENLNFNNIIFWGILFVISYIFSNIIFKYKSLFIGLFAIAALYIQLVIDQYVMSEEFFLNSLAVLLIIKFSELSDKNNNLSFNLICMVVAVASLIKDQGIISSIVSFSIIILLVINMYFIQQKELLEFSFKNILKYLGFGLSIFPFIIIFYLIFPRAEINFRLFDNSASSLGIPDTISLGSFSQFSNSDEEIFMLINNGYSQDDLYFRVKIFDYMEENQSWRPSSSYYLFSKFKDDFKISNKIDLNNSYQIILEPYKKKWIPSLKNSQLVNENIKITKDLFNETFISKDLIDRKKNIKFKSIKTNLNLDEEILKYYTLLPKTVSNKLKLWVSENNNSTKVDFINKIYERFSNGSYFYNLSPKKTSINNYENFFFNDREGYCEYYAGTFVLLARLAGVPSRVVTGYYGGELNEVGNFYSFKQKDTHAWAEVWLDDKGWVRIDPTKAIPKENIINSLNNVFTTNDFSSNGLFSSKFIKTLGFYFNYLDFVWTQHLLSYDDKQRKNFIERVLNLQFSKIFIWIFAPLLIYILVRLILSINSINLLKFRLFIILFGKRKNLNILKSDTLQQVYYKLSSNDKQKYKLFFKVFEEEVYSNNKLGFIKIFKLVF